MGFVGDFLFGEGGSDPQAFRAPGFQEQGDLLNQIFQDQAGGAFAAGQASPLSPTTQAQGSFGGFAPQFQQGGPFQFQQSGFNPAVAAGGQFAAPFEQQVANLRRSGTQQREDILDDLNRRGLGTAGATTGSLLRQREGENIAAGNLRAQAAGAQAQARLGAEQFGAGLNMQQQVQQAADVFRNRGLSSQQAQAAAQAAIQQQQAGLQQQQQAFQQQFNVGQFGQQQIDDLLQLFTLSAGNTPGSQGSSGFLAPVLGAAGSAFGGPVGGALGNVAGDAISGAFA